MAGMAVAYWLQAGGNVKKLEGALLNRCELWIEHKSGVWAMRHCHGVWANAARSVQACPPHGNLPELAPGGEGRVPPAAELRDG
jgi:hypothetical protein